MRGREAFILFSVCLYLSFLRIGFGSASLVFLAAVSASYILSCNFWWTPELTRGTTIQFVITLLLLAGALLYGSVLGAYAHGPLMSFVTVFYVLVTMIWAMEWPIIDPSFNDSLEAYLGRQVLDRYIQIKEN